MEIETKKNNRGLSVGWLVTYHEQHEPDTLTRPDLKPILTLILTQRSRTARLATPRCACAGKQGDSSDLRVPSFYVANLTFLGTTLSALPLKQLLATLTWKLQLPLTYTIVLLPKSWSVSRTPWKYYLFPCNITSMEEVYTGFPWKLKSPELPWKGLELFTQ